MATEPITTDSTAAPSPATVETPKVVEGVDAELTPPEGISEKAQERFQKLAHAAKEGKAAAEKLAGYERYGSPEQIEAFVSAYQELAATAENLKGQIQALQSQREPGEPKTTEQKQLEQQEAEAAKQLRKLLPGYEQMEQFLEQESQRRQVQAELLREDAVSSTAKVMADYGLATKPQDVLEMCDILEPIIRRDPKLALRFERDPEKAIGVAMDRFITKAKEGIDRKAQAETQRQKEKAAGLPRAHGGGGGPGLPKATEAPKTVSEAVRGAMASFREQNRG